MLVFSLRFHVLCLPMTKEVINDLLLAHASSQHGSHFLLVLVIKLALDEI